MFPTRFRTAAFDHHRTIAVLAALLLLVLTGCGLLDRDDRPASDYATFAQEVAALPAVASVGPTPDATDHLAKKSFVATLDEGADAVALRTTASRLTTLLDQHRYPDGTPHITVTSGPFTASLPWDVSVPPGASPVPNTMDLTDLPQLLALPDVAEGTLHGGHVGMTLTSDTDLRSWVEDAVTREGTSRLTVNAETNPDSSPRSTEKFTFPLGSDTAAEAVSALFSLTDSVGATVLTATVNGETQPTADFLLPTADDLPLLHDALIDEYGGRQPEGFSIDTGDGLSVHFPKTTGGTGIGHGTGAGTGTQSDTDPIDNILAARADLDEVEAVLTSVSLDTDSVEVEAKNGDVLRDVAKLVGSPEWPFAPQGTVSIHHPDAPEDHPYFPAAQWGDHADLLASLWDAGFTSVRYSGPSSLTITVSNRQGPDYTTPPGRDALVRALRDSSWAGTARISLDEGSHPTFESTATGTAQNPYNSLSGADDEPYGWGLEFIEAWDASAG